MNPDQKKKTHCFDPSLAARPRTNWLADHLNPIPPRMRTMEYVPTKLGHFVLLGVHVGTLRYLNIAIENGNCLIVSCPI